MIILRLFRPTAREPCPEAQNSVGQFDDATAAAKVVTQMVPLWLLLLPAVEVAVDFFPPKAAWVDDLVQVPRKEQGAWLGMQQKDEFQLKFREVLYLVTDNGAISCRMLAGDMTDRLAAQVNLVIMLFLFEPFLILLRGNLSNPIDHAPDRGRPL
jgi:hypothetical protein